jgi:hypothetical protein
MLLSFPTLKGGRIKSLQKVFECDREERTRRRRVSKIGKYLGRSGHRIASRAKRVSTAKVNVKM